MNALSRTAAPAIAAFLALAPFCGRAWSIFGSQRRDIYDRAEDQFAAAAEARAKGRAIDEYEALVSALRDYGTLATEHPDYRTQQVRERGAAAQMRLAELTEGIRNGTIPVLDSDVDGSGTAAATLAAGDVPPVPDDAANREPEGVAGARERYPMPSLLRAETGNRKEDGAIRAPEAPPVPPVADRSVQPVADRPVPVPEKPEAAQGKNAQPDSGRNAAARIRALSALVKSGQAAEAVVMAEDELEACRDERDAVAIRTILARALLECRNVERAAEELEAIPREADNDPAVRSVRSAAALAQGRFPEAILQLHLLVMENPSWADAWIDLAWATFLMDPEANRESSVSNYRTALAHGARRDPELERLLGVRVGDPRQAGAAGAPRQ